MTRAESKPVLVTGSTGQVGRMVVDRLLDAGVPVRALMRQPATPAFPEAVEVVHGDLTVPDSLEDALRGVSAVFLVWTLPFATAPAAIERMGRHARRIVFLSAPHRTPHPFFQQPNPMARLHADIEQLIADAGVISTVIRPGCSPRTHSTGGLQPSEADTRSAGPTPRPRPRPSTTVTSRRLRPISSATKATPEPTTSSPDLNH